MNILECDYICDMLLFVIVYSVHHIHVFDAHARTLIYHHDAMAVTHLQDLLGVWVVAGAERVGPQPLQQVKVLDNQGPVEAFTSNLQHKDERQVGLFIIDYYCSYDCFALLELTSASSCLLTPWK